LVSAQVIKNKSVFCKIGSLKVNWKRQLCNLSTLKDSEKTWPSNTYNINRMWKI